MHLSHLSAPNSQLYGWCLTNIWVSSSWTDISLTFMTTIHGNNSLILLHIYILEAIKYSKRQRPGNSSTANLMIPLLFLPIDINECELRINNCDVNANCSNTFGSFECTCSAGFVGDGVNCTSKDLHCHTSICKVYDVYTLHVCASEVQYWFICFLISRIWCLFHRR